MTSSQRNWLRSATLVVAAGENGIDLSRMHFKFEVKQDDEQTPNNARIRVYNLSESTINSVEKEYTRVILNVGYKSGDTGVIFDGTIKQFARGRERNVDSYLDIMAADGDIPHNFGITAQTLPAGSTPEQRVKVATEAAGFKVGAQPPYTGGILPRGKVLFGMARAALRREAQSQGATWSIQNGAVQIIPLTGYLPGEAVQLNSATGLIGIPEQTDGGMRLRALINPKLVVGGRIQINNSEINTTVAAAGQAIAGAQLAFNNYGVQLLADTAADGMYRIYVIEHTGDTRGHEWYSDITCLAIDPSTDTVKAYG